MTWSGGPQRIVRGENG